MLFHLVLCNVRVTAKFTSEGFKARVVPDVKEERILARVLLVTSPAGVPPSSGHVVVVPKMGPIHPTMVEVFAAVITKMSGFTQMNFVDMVGQHHVAPVALSALGANKFAFRAASRFVTYFDVVRKPLNWHGYQTFTAGGLVNARSGQ